MERDTRRLALLSVSLGIIAVTLLPERAGLSRGFEADRIADLVPALIKNLREGDLLDVLQNILLFLPLGFLVATRTEGAVGRLENRVRWACLAGFLLSASVETVQIWIPGRYCSLQDILSNALGAGIGGYLATRISARNPLGPL